MTSHKRMVTNHISFSFGEIIKIRFRDNKIENNILMDTEFVC